ncbi:MAG TPA: hypothetical protein VMP08_04190 [Anaerolineae bacterium]|nr:hypothetical protein [Anaerolineae bacterium]
MLAARKIFGNTAGRAGALAAMMAFITDVLQPLGNFAPWVACASFIVALVSGISYYRHWRKPGVDKLEHPLLGLFVLSLAFTILFGVWSFVEAKGPDRGYLAQNVNLIAQFQTQLLGMQQDVTNIKETTQANTAVIAAAATQQAQSATQINALATAQAAAAAAQAQDFKDIQAAFQSLSSQGAIVPDPKTPQEWYANARLYQLKGDTANAIKSYEGYFTFGLEYVDPYLEYTALIRATDGAAHARQLIDDMRQTNPNSPALDLISAQLLDAPVDRLQRLTALTTRAPQFGPAFDALAQEYDRALQATMTNDLLEKQQAAYAAVFKLEETQAFSRFYIDKALADKQLADARTMQTGYANAATAFKAVDVQTYPYYNGVQFVVVLPEVFNAKQLLFGIDEPQPKTDAGHTGAGAQTFVNTTIGPIPLAVGDHTFTVQYVDANGVLSPVTSKKFRVDPIAITFNQQPPDFSTNTIPGLFSVGIVGTQGFEPYTYHYSLDSAKLDQTLASIAFTAINVDGLTHGDHTLYIRATSADGKQTPLVKYAFTVK